MLLNLKSAFAKLKKERNQALHYFFVEQGPGGEPVLIVDAKPIATSVKNEALKGAKKEGKSAGTLLMNAEAGLQITPRGSAPSSLAKGVRLAAHNAGTVNFRDVDVMKSTPAQEDKDDDGGTSGPSKDEQAWQAPLDELGPRYVQALKGREATIASTLRSHMAMAQGKAEAGDHAGARLALGTLDEVIRKLPVDSPDGKRSTTDEKLEDSLARFAERESKRAASDGKHADPRAADPRIARLLTERAEAKKRLQAAGGNADAATQALELLERIDAALETAQRQLNREGIVPQQRRAEYAQEDQRRGEWRSYTDADKAKLAEEVVRHPNESDGAFKARREQLRVEQEEVRRRGAQHAASDAVRTHMFDDDARKRSKVEVRDGRLHGGRGFDAHGAAQGKSAPLDAADDREYVMGRDGSLYQFKEAASVKTSDNKEMNTHHSSVLAGEEVAGAGRITTEAGRLTAISNMSGHYKPGVAQMIQTLELLLKQGAFLDHTWTDSEGNPPTGKAGALLENYLKLNKATETCHEQAETLKDSARQEDQARLEKLALGFPKLHAALDAAKAALDKLGVAPARRGLASAEDAGQPGARVVFLDGASKLAGADVKRARNDAEAKASTVKDFLRSGGGNTDEAPKKLAAKAALHEELGRKQEANRAELDEEAEKGSERVATARAKLEADLQKPIPALPTEYQDGSPIPEDLRVDLLARLEAGRERTRRSLQALADPSEQQIDELTAGLVLSLNEALDETLGKKALQQVKEAVEQDRLQREHLASLKDQRATFAGLERAAADLTAHIDADTELDDEEKKRLGESLEFAEQAAERIGKSLGEGSTVRPEALKELDERLQDIREAAADYVCDRRNEQARRAEKERQEAEALLAEQSGFYALPDTQQTELLRLAAREVERRRQSAAWEANGRTSNYEQNPYAQEESEIDAFERLPEELQERLLNA